MAERRATPGDDLISDIVRVEVDGERLTDEEIYSFLRLLLPAGVETTYRATGNLLLGAAQRPGPVRRPLRRPLPVPAGLRGGGALGGSGHRHPAPCHADTELAGVPISGGRRRRAADRRGQSRRPQVRRTRPLRHVPDGAPARRIRLRCPRVPRHAPGPHGVTRRHQHPLRPAWALHAWTPAAEPPHIEGLAFRSPLSLPVVFSAA